MGEPQTDDPDVRRGSATFAETIREHIDCWLIEFEVTPVEIIGVLTAEAHDLMHRADTRGEYDDRMGAEEPETG
jgi:hypothetical protein